MHRTPTRVWSAQTLFYGYGSGRRELMFGACQSTSGNPNLTKWVITTSLIPLASARA